MRHYNGVRIGSEGGERGPVQRKRRFRRARAAIKQDPVCASDRKQRAWTWPTSSSNSRINLNCQAPALAVLFPLPPSLSRCSIESTTLLVHYYCTNAAADAALSFHRKSRRQNCERHFGQLATRHFSFSLSFNKRQFW